MSDEKTNIEREQERLAHAGLLIMLQSPAVVENILQELNTSTALSPWGIAIAERLLKTTELEKRVKELEEALQMVIEHVHLDCLMEDGLKAVLEVSDADKNPER